MKTIMYLLSLLLVLFIASCSEDDNEQLLKLESYETEINFGKTKYVAITDWEGDRSKITITSDDENLISVGMVDYIEAGRTEDIPYIRLLGVGNGETSLIVKDEKGNQALFKVKAIDELAGFKSDGTVRLLLNDTDIKIDLKEGDLNGGKYTFGRDGDIVTFKWSNETNGKSATIVYTETSKEYDFSWNIMTDAVLTLINPNGEKEADKKIVIELPYLKVIGTQARLITPEGGGVTQQITEKAWILFRLPAKNGQEKGTLGYCVGAITNKQ